jgi:hypothetical protein
MMSFTKKKRIFLLWMALFAFIAGPFVLLFGDSQYSLYKKKYAEYERVKTEARNRLRNAFLSPHTVSSLPVQEFNSTSNLEPFDWGTPLLLAGATMTLYGAGFPICLAVLPWLYAKKSKIKSFLESRRGRLLTVLTFAPSVVYCLIAAFNDDLYVEVFIGSFIAGPVIVWSCIGLYVWIKKGN